MADRTQRALGIARRTAHQHAFDRTFQEGGVADDPYDPLAASAGVAPLGTPRVDQIDWGQPSWAQQAVEQSQRDREAYGKEGVPGMLRDTEGAQDLVGGFSDAPLGLGIKAFHGSPHDFERFDMSKIGTGEGAQAYGHGLYFAENPKTAQQYRESLGQKANKVLTPEGGEIPSTLFWGPEGEKLALQELKNAGSFDLARSRLQTALENTKSWGNPGTHLSEALTHLDRLQSSGYQAKAGGKTYEVSINADPEHFLDWDKPLSEQPEHVKTILQNHPTFESVRDVHSQLMPRQIAPSTETGIQSFREAGIPGIKYLDQGSRNAGAVTMRTQYRDARLDNSPHSPERFFAARYQENGADIDRTIAALKDDAARHPSDQTVQDALKLATTPDAQFAHDKTTHTHNFVVFDDKLIDIIKKYGLAGLIAGGAAHYSLPSDEGMVPKQPAEGGKVTASQMARRHAHQDAFDRTFPR